MDERPRLAFWAHQATEYLLGVLLFLMALRMVGAPMLFALGAGLLLTALAALSVGPLAAFRWFSRATHRALDIAMAVFLAASPLLLRFGSLWLTVVAEGLAVAMATLVRRTAYADPPRRPRPSRRSAAPVINATARTAGHRLGRAANEAPRRLGRFVGRHRRPPG